jgi:hypothetical protein
MIGFALGALIGAGSIWYWGDRIRALAGSNMSEDRKLPRRRAWRRGNSRSHDRRTRPDNAKAPPRQ